MSRVIRTREEDRQALIDLVKEEIESHRRGEITNLTSNVELAEILSCSIKTLIKVLSKISEIDRKYREISLKSQGGEIGGRIEQEYLEKIQRQERAIT